ncbi:MAG TPA: DUF3108 domain-containing protein [Syntrophobacteria bacterium]|nr:DUF3108 domain-containing protein [Syntrophobacteria bacterium]
MDSRHDMRKRKIPLAPLVVLVLACAVPWPSWISEGSSRTDGEKLTYTLRWGPIRAGTATLESLGRAEVDGRQALHFRGTIQTESFAAVIHNVRNTLEGFTDPGMSRTLLYLRNQEGAGELNHARIVFDTENNTATYCKSGQRCRTPIPIHSNTLDPISCIFWFRSFSLGEPAETRIHVSNGRTAVWVAVRFAGREQVTTPAGMFTTFKVEATIEWGRGFFGGSQTTKLLVWFTDTPERLPVMAQGALVFGPFMAELIDISRPGPEPPLRVG